jgi:hypothetical protein
MKTLKLIASSLLVAALSLGFVGCSSDSDSYSASNLTGSPVPITDVNEAELAILATTSIIELGSENVTEYADIDSIPHATSPALAISLAPVNEQVNCQRYGEDTDGTFSAVGEESETNIDMTYTFNECWISDSNRINGEVKLSGTINDNGLATLNVQTIDYFMVGEYTMNTSSVLKFYPDGSNSSVDILLNGKVKKYYTESEAQIGYENFHYAEDENELETIEGKVSILGSPNSCSDGIYTLETLEKISSNSEGTPISGKIKINGTTYQFNSEGTVSLTFSDGSTKQFSFEDVESASCTQ